MNTLTKLVLGAMGALRPQPALEGAQPTLDLPRPEQLLDMPLTQALTQRRSAREFDARPLPLDVLASVLWAADGVNRDDGGRTAPSALGAKEVQVYVALPQGAYRYDPDQQRLHLVASADVRRVTGYQDFVDTAPLDLVFVADHRHLSAVPVASRDVYAHVACGAIAQNVYLACAALGLSTVVRAWIDREAIARALGLSMEQHVLLSQTVGYPKST